MGPAARGVVLLQARLLFLHNHHHHYHHYHHHHHRDVHGKPVQEYWHDMKFWWPHCEAIIATLLAWKLTGNSRYAEMHAQVHDWSFAHFPDREYGEWFGYLHRDGTPSQRAKGNLFKGPFHLPRMLWFSSQELSAAP
jgi:N-acylglucosamine 2-epimerase